ncbi:MAG: hypothetical protein H6654_13240 [Ardenticatenaceae bacterium]|nr:hypothetical protein [Anaerolineales bacterium]MCB8941589.1 hypothetical protein [Ardenticatenaceae bacterium]MCB8974517.1 hypothetical protein [Ardenticatenaceae bacterium]
MNQENLDTNWKTKLLLIGAASGALLGIGTAYLLARSAENNQGGPPEISTKDLLSTGIAIIGVIRGIASLGDGSK